MFEEAQKNDLLLHGWGRWKCYYCWAHSCQTATHSQAGHIFGRVFCFGYSTWRSSSCASCSHKKYLVIYF